MKLKAAQTLELSQIVPYILREEGEAPLWKFAYDRHRQDPVPQVLVLGSYRHPATGNLLVGGININYLSNRQKERLRISLPKLMKARNLYYRYHSGLRLLPDIFDAFYRTYNPSYIRAVNKSALYPKEPPDQARRDLAKARLDKIRKTREARLQQAMPKYPSDLSQMDKTLDQKTAEVATKPTQEQPSVEPEIANAKQNYARIKQEREAAERNKIQQLSQDAKRAQGYVAPEPEEPNRQEMGREIGAQRKSTRDELNALSKARAPDPLAPTVQPRIIPAREVPPREVPPREAPPREAPPRETAPEITEPEDDDIELAEEPGLGESIVYWDPRCNRYIIEPAFELISNWKPMFDGKQGY